jgi:hypothetical protein
MVILLPELHNEYEIEPVKSDFYNHKPYTPPRNLWLFFHLLHSRPIGCLLRGSTAKNFVTFSKPVEWNSKHIVTFWVLIM